MPFRLRYGGEWLEFELPEGFEPTLIAEKEGPPSLDPRRAVEEALEKPADGVKLSDLVKPGYRVALIVDDATRATPVVRIADLVLRELEKAEEVEVVMALGLHPPPSKDKVATKLGEELAEKVMMHNPRGDLVYVGRTVNGTEIYVNRLVAEADVRVAIGTITPHPFAGFSGGPKILLPGVAGEETIKANHSLLSRPGAALGVMEGNPIYADEAYVASKLPTYIVNLIPSPSGGYLGAVAGEALKAHREGTSKFMEHYFFKLPEPVDVAITTSHPVNVNLYQAWKGIFAVADAVKPGGTIILATPAYEGMPSEKAETLRRYELPKKTEKEIEAMLDKLPDYVFALIYLKLRMILRGKRLIVVTDNMSEEEVQQLGFEYSPTIEDALKKTELKKAKVLINPTGAEALIKSR